MDCQTVLEAVRTQLLCSRQENAVKQGAAWRQSDWWSAFKVVFIDAEGNEAQDDLLLLVLFKPQGGAPYVVRRKGPGAMDADICYGGALYAAVDWQASFRLNLVLHSQYQLTVAVCPMDELQTHNEARDPGPRTVRVRKEVHARPTREGLSAGGARSDATPEVSYPDITFAVDNYEEAFDALVMRDGDAAYVVTLQVLQSRPSARDGAAEIQLFSGYVVHAQLVDTMHSKAPVTSLLTGRVPETVRTIRMRGPGGVGLAEVAVSPFYGTEKSGARGRGLTGLVRNVVLELAGLRSGPHGDVAFQCALMSLQLPVDSLSEAILQC